MSYLNYLQYDESGRVLCTGSAPDSASLSDLGLVITSDEPFSVDFSEDYIQDGEIIRRPQSPSPHHEWDWPTKSWLPNLDAARNAKLQEVAAELSTRLYLPHNGFDANKVSRERISGTIARLQRGDGLPAGWVGWRDAENNMHWSQDDAATVLANLTALSRAIEDREQALLIAAWDHKRNITDLPDIDAIIGYDLTANWPV